MSAWLLLVPAVYFAAMTTYSPVRLQPKLTLARTPADFVAAVARSGGGSAVRRGFAIDAGFIIVFAALIPAFVAVRLSWGWVSSQPWRRCWTRRRT